MSGTVRPGAINLFLSIFLPVHVLVGRLEKVMLVFDIGYLLLRDT